MTRMFNPPQVVLQGHVRLRLTGIVSVLGLDIFELLFELIQPASNSAMLFKQVSEDPLIASVEWVKVCTSVVCHSRV